MTLFGAPTGGSIDYQSVAKIRFGCPDAGLYLGYPTMVGEHVGPEGGVNTTGIVPDVMIPNGVDDPVAWLVAYLGRQDL